MRESRHRFRSTRVSHADRDETCERLRLAAGNGRLDVEELERRLERAYAARTYGELQSLVRDLPPDGPGEPITSRDTTEIDHTGMHVVRRGQWQVPRRVLVSGKFGASLLDFSRAVIQHREVEIVLDTDWSSVRIVVAKGTGVDAEDLAMSLGSLTNNVASVPQSKAVMFRVAGSHTGGRVRIAYAGRFRR